MPTKLPTGEVISIGSHSITEDYHQAKEEFFVYVASEWRGEPCRATIEVSRQRYSRNENDWSEWRAWCREARTMNANDGTVYGNGAHDLSDTARARMSEAFSALALSFANGAPIVYKDGRTRTYRDSRADALRNNVSNLLREARPYDNATREARATLKKYSADMRADDVDRMTRAADAYDLFSEIMREGEK